MDESADDKEKGPARGSRPCRAEIKNTNNLDHTDDDASFQHIGTAANWIVARIAERHRLTRTTAGTVCTLAGLGSAPQ